LSPQWLAHRFDETTNQVRFVDYDRATRASVAFLTDEHLPQRDFQAIPREQAKAVAIATAPVYFVFHSGFCCSTLFAKCLDQPGLATAFSEPMILNDVVGWRKRGATPAEVGRLLDDALGFLARPFEGDQAAIVKPSTIVNGLAAAMLGLRPSAKAVLMYAPLEDFLTSIAKKGIDGRLWVRELFLIMRREGLVDGLGFGDEQFFGQTDLQIAAITWLGQQRIFSDVIRRFPERARTLDSDAFLSCPEKALAAAGELFGLPLSEAQIASAAAGALSRNSKDGKPYDREARTSEYDAARALHGDEIAKVASWARTVADAAGISLEPGASLI
jgi:hypothetical protein